MKHLSQLVYINSFILGFIVMSFEMLGSRYLNPYFGSSIYTWASLISVVLVALSLGYFMGGIWADRNPSPLLLGGIIIGSSIWLFLIPLFNNYLFDFVFESIEDVRYGSLISAALLLLFPLTILSVYSPFAIRLTLKKTKISGTISGRIYGISTAGSVLGTLITTFYLIPTIGTKMITFVLSGITFLVGASFLILHFVKKDG